MLVNLTLLLLLLLLLLFMLLKLTLLSHLDYVFLSNTKPA
jgi:hypothetical protein